jgi:hypothetical protein
LIGRSGDPVLKPGDPTHGRGHRVNNSGDPAIPPKVLVQARGYRENVLDDLAINTRMTRRTETANISIGRE